MIDYLKVGGIRAAIECSLARYLEDMAVHVVALIDSGMSPSEATTTVMAAMKDAPRHVKPENAGRILARLREVYPATRLDELAVSAFLSVIKTTKVDPVAVAAKIRTEQDAKIKEPEVTITSGSANPNSPWAR